VDKKNEQGPEGYEPPGFDEVLSAEDLEREIQYAGITISGPVG
jgi:hypothetical protein